MRAMGLRALTAAAVLVSAFVHLWLWEYDGFRYLTWIGPLFLLNAAAGVALAVAVVGWRHWLPALGCLGFGLATLGAFLISATVGLFGVHETFAGSWQLAAAAAEVVAAAGGAALLRSRLSPAAGTSRAVRRTRA